MKLSKASFVAKWHCTRHFQDGFFSYIATLLFSKLGGKFLSKRCRLWVAKLSIFSLAVVQIFTLGISQQKRVFKKLGANFKKIKIKVGNWLTNCLAFYKKQKLCRLCDNFLLTMLFQQSEFSRWFFCWLLTWHQPRFCLFEALQSGSLRTAKVVFLVLFVRWCFFGAGGGWWSHSQDLWVEMADGRFIVGSEDDFLGWIRNSNHQ